MPLYIGSPGTITRQQSAACVFPTAREGAAGLGPGRRVHVYWFCAAAAAPQGAAGRAHAAGDAPGRGAGARRGAGASALRRRGVVAASSRRRRRPREIGIDAPAPRFSILRGWSQPTTGIESKYAPDVWNALATPLANPRRARQNPTDDEVRALVARVTGQAKIERNVTGDFKLRRRAVAAPGRGGAARNRRAPRGHAGAIAGARARARACSRAGRRRGGAGVPARGRLMDRM